jgi:hypothetical protein
MLLGATTGLVILLGAREWLVREDPLTEATAIAVLSGNIPTRALEAARLYHDGYAKEIWLTHPCAHADVLEVLGIYYSRESDFNVWVLGNKVYLQRRSTSWMPRSSTQPRNWM